MKFQAELNLAEKTARAAGALLRDMMTGERVVLSQIGRDIKMQADRDAEAKILAMLRAESSYPIITEETGRHGDIGAGPYWVVDPLDGTLNFSRQIPLCCTSIGLMQGDESLLGVIYDFNRDEMFSGIPGEGAWLNGRPIKVSSLADKTQAILASGMTSYGDYTLKSRENYVDLIHEFKKTRMLGSACLAFAYVACGRIDAYFEQDFMIWDVAAGAAIVRAAGGWIEVERGNAGELSRRARTAGNPKLWENPDR